MRSTFVTVCLLLIATTVIWTVGQAATVVVEDIDPSGQLGPGDPHATGNVDNTDDQLGGIFIAKEPDGRWHVVGAGLLPWGGTQVEMVALAVNADGTSAKMSPEGEFVEDGDDADNEVFDSPEGSQIDWIKIKRNRAEMLTWYNGTGAWDGIWFTAEGAFVVFETLGMNDDALGGADSACDVFGDRGCLIADPLPPAPPERIWIGGDAPDNWEHPSQSAPFALKNTPDAPDTLVSVELKGKRPTTWGDVKED